MPLKFLITRSRSEAAVDSGRAFVSSTGPRTVASGDNYIGFFQSGSNKTVYIRRIIFGCDATMRCRITQAPTVSANGSAQTVMNRRMGKGFLNEAVLYNAPTVTGQGTVLYDFWVNAGQPPFILDFRDHPWIMDPANSLLIDAVAGGSNNASLTIEWDEETR
jgi:hypothetical protein